MELGFLAIFVGIVTMVAAIVTKKDWSWQSAAVYGFTFLWLGLIITIQAWGET